IPLSKLVLGVPTYGHSSKVNPTSAFHGTSLVAYPPFNKAVHVQGDSWTSGAGVDQCGKQTAPDDTVKFWSLVAQGYLKDDGTPGKDIAYRFDSCSRTAYVYDKAKQVMVSFDDAKSFAAKGKFIKDAGIAGFSMWLAGGDHKDILLDSIRKAGGFPQKD
ncbi:glycoside hydrolase family 18 protein, partial [Amanita muscaria Koide BX008]